MSPETPTARRLPLPGSLEHVTQYLQVLLGHNHPGVIWVEYSNDAARDAAIQRFPAAERIGVEHAGSWADWEILKDKLATCVGVVHVVFSALIGSGPGEREPGREFAHALNLNREWIFELPLQQVWWLSGRIVEPIRALAPDFLSWVQHRLVLSEIVSPSGIINARGLEESFAKAELLPGPV